jgi:hypothetical protein
MILVGPVKTVMVLLEVLLPRQIQASGPVPKGHFSDPWS